jgi:hypothetical protein
MDIEYGGWPEETPGMGTNDAIEVIVPPKLKELMDNINNARLDIQTQIGKKKLETKTCEPGKYDRRKDELDKLLMKDANILSGFIKEFKESNLESSKFDYHRDDDEECGNPDIKNILNAVNSTIFMKNEEFSYTIQDEIIRFIKDSKHRYYVLFIEFQSGNMTEMGECEYNEDKCSTNALLADVISLDMIYHIQIKEMPDVDKIIEDLQTELDKTFVHVKSKKCKGYLDESQSMWIVIYFTSKFFLTELALEKLIKFIDEVYYTSGVRFVFIFKKIEDATVFPAFHNTFFKFVIYDKNQNLFFDFLIRWFEDSQGRDLGRVLGRRVLSKLVEQFDSYKKNVRGAVSTVTQMYRLSRALHPDSPMSDDVKGEINVRRLRFQNCLLYFKSVICPKETDKDIKLYSDFVVRIYSNVEEVKIIFQLKNLTENSKNMSLDNLLKIIETLKFLLSEALLKTTIENPFSDILMAKFNEMEKEIRGDNEKKEVNEAPRTRAGKAAIAKDHKDRIKQLIQAKHMDVSKEDIDLFEKYIEDLSDSIVGYVDSCIDDYHRYIKSHAFHLLIDEFEELVDSLEPDIQGNYMSQLSKPYHNFNATKMNPAELAVRVLFDVIANENFKFYVSKIKSQFELKLQLLGLNKDATETKHLFYFSLNLLKRSGLIHEQNRVKQILYKCFFNRTRLHHSQV